MLALEHGASCHGIAYRIDSAVADHELDIIWNREMVSGAYIPKIVRIHTPLGIRRAIAFVINREHLRYSANIPLEEAAQIIAIAEGWLGKCCDYLFNTVEHLDELGVHDPAMHHLDK